jgi:hypothetical protein
LGGGHTLDLEELSRGLELAEAGVADDIVAGIAALKVGENEVAG